MKKITCIIVVLVLIISMSPSLRIEAIAEEKYPPKGESIWNELNGEKLNNANEFVDYLNRIVGERFSSSSKCQAFVYQAILHCFGKGNTGKVCCASSAYKEYCIDSSLDIPIGAAVYFSGSNVICKTCKRSDAGHVAIYIGNGEIIHCFGQKIDGVKYKGFIRRDPLSLITKSLGYKYLGWGWQGGYEIPLCPHSQGYETVYEGGRYFARCKQCHQEYTPKFYSDSAGIYRITSNINLNSAPYQEAQTSVTCKSGQQVTISGHVINAYNNKWYKTDDGYYIYNTYAELVQQTSALSISVPAANYSDRTGMPSGSIVGGKSWGLRGTISSNYQLTRVECHIYDSSDNDAVTAYINTSPNTNSYDIRNGGMNDSIKFSKIPVGNNYKIVISAQDSSGAKKYVESSFNIVSSDPQTPSTYTIHYNANGGTGAPASQNKTQGTALTLSSTKPTRTGYTFQGWATSAIGSVQYQPGGSYTADAGVTLYAIWSINKLTMRYNINGGEIGSNGGGFSSASNGMVQKNGSELVVIWEYNFGHENGLYNASTFGLTRSDYQFLGWSTSSDGSTRVFDQDDGTIVAQDISPSLSNGNASVTLYAIWTPVYYLDLNGYLDSESSCSNINEYGTADVYINGVLVANDVKDYFTAWPVGTSYEIKDIKAADGKYYWGVTEGALSGTLNKRTSVRLHFSTIYGNGSRTIPDGQYQIALAEDPNLVLGVAGDGGNGSNVELTANQNLDSQTFDVCYLGDSSYTISAMRTGRALNIQDNQTTEKTNIQVWDYTGNANAKWVIQALGNDCYSIIALNSSMYVDVAGGEFENGSNIWIYSGNNTASQIFRFVPVPSEVEVSYHANGGTGAPDSQSKARGSDLTLSETRPTRKGYFFTGWAMSADADTAVYQPGDSFTLNTDTALYAVWLEKPDFVESDSVTYVWDGNNGTVNDEYGNLLTETWIRLTVHLDSPDGDNIIWRYTDENGQLVEGWRVIDTDTYYFHGSITFSNIRNQPYIIDDAEYFFDAEGRMIRDSWCQSVYNGELIGPKCYADGDGHLLRGWHTIDGKQYYFNEESGKVPGCYQNGVYKINGNVYRFDADGVMTDWLDLSSPDCVLPASLLSIDDEAFFGCGFRYVRLPDGAESIGKYAFAESETLEYIYIPECVTDIAPDAFDKVEGLTIIGVSGSTAADFAKQYGFSFIEG